MTVTGIAENHQNVKHHQNCPLGLMTPTDKMPHLTTVTVNGRAYIYCKACGGYAQIEFKNEEATP